MILLKSVQINNKTDEITEIKSSILCLFSPLWDESTIPEADFSLLLIHPMEFRISEPCLKIH